MSTWDLTRGARGHRVRLVGRDAFCAFWCASVLLRSSASQLEFCEVAFCSREQRSTTLRRREMLGSWVLFRDGDALN